MIGTIARPPSCSVIQHISYAALKRRAEERESSSPAVALAKTERPMARGPTLPNEGLPIATANTVDTCAADLHDDSKQDTVPARVDFDSLGKI